MGHCCAAEAIRQEIAAVNPQAEVFIVDLIDYLFPHMSKYIYRTFTCVVNRYSAVYNFLNHAAGRCGILPMKAVIAHKIDRLLCECRADIVVSTLPICSQCISAYKQRRGSRIPLYTYITDIGAQDEWIVPHTDAYFVGANDTKNELIDKGIHTSRIHVCGIPVRHEFLLPISHAPVSAQTEVLIMGGGLGLIPSSDALLSALSRIDGVHLTVITGKNKALYARLKEKYPAIAVIGYTEHVADYMRRADLLITKSGGITTFEAIHCGTPLYVIRPFLMQEISNAEYIERNHIGRVVWSQSADVTHDMLSLLHDTARLHTMKQNMQQLRLKLEPLCPSVYFNKEASFS